MVSMWFSGRTVPNGGTKLLIEEEFGISRDAWDMPAVAPTVAEARVEREPEQVPPPPPVQIEGLDESVFAQAKALQEEAKVLLREARTDPDLSLGERARILNVCAQALNHSAKLTGDFELGARLCQLPIWKKVLVILERVHTGHPEIAARFLEEIKRERILELGGGA